MRIRAGSFKGRTLKSPPGRKIRPTSARVKEAFFNIVGGYLEDANFLDLFSGTGSIGLEALSRGAGQVYFVEKDRLSLKTLYRNVDATGMRGGTKILALDAKQALQLLSKKKESFEIIYIDPPYGYQKVAGILNCLRAKRLVKEGGIIGVERGSLKGKQAGAAELEGEVPFHLWKKRTYGNTLLFIFKNIQDINAPV